MLQVFIITSILTISSVFYALSIDKYYKASVLVVSSLESSAQNSVLSGIFGSSDQRTVSSSEITSEEALATLTSRNFIERFISESQLLPIIFPKSWDSDNKIWLQGLDDIPTLSDGYELVVDNLDLQFDASLITIEFIFHDKTEVATLLNSLISDVNSFIRNRSILDSQKNISFLEQEITKTQLTGSREMLFRIVEQQTQSIMLANTREDYAFRLIDPAIEPSTPAGPNRKLIVIVGFIIGLVFSAFYVLILNSFKINRSN